jgi:hypothetical protein
MSRPPRVNRNDLSSAYNQPVIDFVNKGYPVGTHYEPSVYAQAGYPGYIQAGYYPPQAGYQAYDPGMYQTMAQPYQPYQPMAQPYQPMAQAYQPVSYQQPTYSSLSSGETEDQMREKINAKIDAIIEAQRESSKEQRADLLSTQIDKLTRKVHKLSAALEQKSSPRAEHLSADADVAEQLRALAEESKEAMSRRKMPDW